MGGSVTNKILHHKSKGRFDDIITELIKNDINLKFILPPKLKDVKLIEVN